MKLSITPLAGLAVLAATAGAALAAPPEYCALYAREYANQFTEAAGEKPGSEQRIQDEAYYRCLNMDENPPMPSASAYSDLPPATADQGGPLEPLAAAPAAGEAAPARADPAPPIPAPARKTADSAPSGRSYTGGLQPWTAEWRAACRKYFPHSFNEKDGTILPNGTKKRVLCK